MKKIVFRVLGVLLILCSLVFTVQFGITRKNQLDYQNVLESRDLRLQTFEDNKELTKKYLQVYSIVDESSYQAVKNDLYSFLSLKLRDEIFPSVNYKGLPLHAIKTDVQRIVGTNNKFSSENLFLIEYRLTSLNYDQVVTNLIYIENGVIQRVIRAN